MLFRVIADVYVARSCITHQMLQNRKCFFCMAEIDKVCGMDDGKEMNVC